MSNVSYFTWGYYMEILKLKPTTKDYLWGGNLLRKKYNKTSKDEIIAESWELSAHKDGLSIIQNGEFEGIDFQTYLDKKGNGVIGKDYDKERFPILIKFIDALKPLSIQVHPKDEYAIKNENDFGKTEMWYVLEAEDNAFLYYGFNKKISKEQYKNSIEDGTIENYLNKVNVKKGDIFFIEAGTVHAIGAGIVIYEIQQNSNVTYRVYDYKRKDKFGNERELHIEKAIEVSNLTPNPTYEFTNENYINPKLKRLAKSEYFDVFKGNVEDGVLGYKVEDSSFQSLTFVEGRGYIEFDDDKIEFNKGDTFFISAQNSLYSIYGEGEFILSCLPMEEKPFMF